MSLTAEKPKTLREQLKGVREAQDEARSKRAELKKSQKEAKEAFAGKDLTDPDVVKSAEFEQAEQVVADLGKNEDLLADLDRTEKAILGMLGDDIPEPSAETVGELLGRAGRDRAKALLEGEAFQRLKASEAFSSRARIGSVALGEFATREETQGLLAGDLLAASGSGAGDLAIGSENKQGAMAADRRGIVEARQRRLSLLDLIPIGATDAKLVEYVQEIAPTEEDPQPGYQKEGEKKAQLTLETRDETEPVVTIAGYKKIKKQALEDVAGLGSLINRRLPWRVRDMVEKQVLAGDGKDDTLTGFLNRDELGMPVGDPLDNTADGILRAMTIVELSDSDATFVALHPLTNQELRLMRENQAERTGAYLYGSPSVLAAPTIWGLTMVGNRMVPTTSPLVGDAQEAEIAVRSGMQVLISDNDGDDFTRNRVTVLAETRLAFLVWRPSAFALAPVPGSGSGSGAAVGSGSGAPVGSGSGV